MEGEFPWGDNWQVVHQQRLPGRTPQFVSVQNMPVHRPTRTFLGQHKNGIYVHQKAALERFLRGQDVCLATGTASGKSLAFFASGIELLVGAPSAKLIAVYPMKSLAREQEERWKLALLQSGVDAEVGRIDGAVPVAVREDILRKSRVLIITPDVLHAWLLGSLASRPVRSFLSSLRLAVVDEVHVYTGVFGSNAAFLFRRLQHATLVASKGHPLQFFAASATVAEPEEHLHSLFARQFQVIGADQDTSPRHPLEIMMVRPPSTQDLNSAVASLLRSLADDGDSRFIAFVDSRKQTERLATITARSSDGDDSAGRGHASDHLAVLPYRSGYEEEDREAIQRRLTRGDLRGVISTSALELGLDIPGINTAVLVGVPRTTTSFQQRIGRVGRHQQGRVIIVDGGGAADQVVFKEPERLFDRPLGQSALYLQNRRIQYLHALCFAAAGAEYDQQTPSQPDGPETDIVTQVEWPPGFLDLCQQERIGQVADDLQSMKVDAGDDPWHAFPLRDVGSQFKIELRDNEWERLGSLSFSQLIREAYPGAVYYYMARPYRVTRVQLREKTVQVRREKYYTTDPIGPPVLVAPRLDSANVRCALSRGSLIAVECNVFISETVTGYKERRGAQSLNYPYPCEYLRARDRFSRNFGSTGVLLAHPSLSQAGVQHGELARLILESFLLAAPFDRSEVSSSTGKHPVDHLRFRKGERFLALYDQTYGSLRLTGRLLDAEVLLQVIEGARDLALAGGLEDGEPLSQATLVALEEILEDASLEPQPLTVEASGTPVEAEESEVVIVPGSVGWIVTDDNQEFLVERVFVNRKGQLQYSGRRPGDNREDIVTSFPASVITPISGVSRLGVYHYDTGDICPLDSDEP